jgi:hypothetical protein
MNPYRTRNSVRVGRLVIRNEDDIWTASSEDIKGLNIEADTREEAISEALSWARELAVRNGFVTDAARLLCVIESDGARITDHRAVGSFAERTWLS